MLTGTKQAPLREPELPAGSDQELSLLEPMIVLAKRKRIFLAFAVGAAVLSVIYALFAPKSFQAETKILPPQQNQSIASAMMGQLGALAGLAGKDLGIRNPNDIYIAMLQSRTVADAMIDRFHLMEQYKMQRRSDARDRLASMTTITSGKDGVISIAVEDRDPARSAEMANAYVEELARLTQTLAVGEAAQRRVFYEAQLKQANDDLARAEQQLRVTQERTGLVQLDAQAKATLESLAVARAQVAAKEVQLRAMQSFATPQNPDLLRTQEELEAMRSNLRQLEGKQPSGELGIGAANVPQAGMEYVRALRQVKYYETVFELLSRQFEAAKIDEARSAAVIQVMDKAMPPDIKFRPKRTRLVLLWTGLGAFIGVLAAFVMEAWEGKRREPEFQAKLALLKQYLHSSK